MSDEIQRLTSTIIESNVNYHDDNARMKKHIKGLNKHTVSQQETIKTLEDRLRTLENKLSAIEIHIERNKNSDA